MASRLSRTVAVDIIAAPLTPPVLMTPAAALSRLSLASRLLLSVVPVHLLLFLPRLAGAPAELFNVVWILSTLLCITGFMLASSLLGLNAEAADFTRTRMSIGRQAEREARWYIVLSFYLSFMVPVLNLLTAMWTLYRVRSAMGALRKHESGRLANEKRREKFGPIRS